MNTGGLRTPLPKGAIKKSKVFELMPFENELVVLTLSGEKTFEMFQFIAKKGGIPVSGFKMGIKDSNVVSVKVGEIKFDKSKKYRIVTSDYLANGGDKMIFFNNPLKRVSLNLKVRDAIIEYMFEETKKGNKLKSKLDSRIYFEK
jgi:2',3'-cyclic-nucleotide 2'-phosphodiesterase (5'-nucleotidase family)